MFDFDDDYHDEEELYAHSADHDHAPKHSANRSRSRVEDASCGLEDTSRIRKTMDERRSLMEKQREADTIKSRLCDQIRADRDRISPSLAKRIATLEHTEPDLFTYIRRLEFVQDGIWCNTCNTIKSIDLTATREHVRPSPTQDTRRGNKTRTTVDTPSSGGTMPAATRHTSNTPLKNHHCAQSLTRVMQRIDAVRSELNTIIQAEVGDASRAKRHTPAGSARTTRYPRAPSSSQQDSDVMHDKAPVADVFDIDSLRCPDPEYIGGVIAEVGADELLAE